MRFTTIFSFFTILITCSLHASEYVAFSLNAAKERINTTPNIKDYRILHPEVFTLGGITAIKGLVYDRKTGDIILVGERNLERSILTLDDFVVALRARFIHGKWPLVSIDPTPETKKTSMQVIRFEGGIANTQFGQDLFEADYKLKEMSMGLHPHGNAGIKSSCDITIENIKKNGYFVNSRFWFYPVLPSVSIRKDIVAIKGLKIGIFTEVLWAEIEGKEIDDLSTFRNPADETFARTVSEKFETLAKKYTSFSRLQGLDELVAITKAIEEMEEMPDFYWWLREYKIKEVNTKKELKVLFRKEEYKTSVSGKSYIGSFEASGGVQLMAIALRIKSGDITALKEAVLKTKPSHNAISWNFVVGDWLIPTSPGMLKMDDIAFLYEQAVFLYNQKHYNDAITLYTKIINLIPHDISQIYFNRAFAYFDKEDYERALDDLNKAIKLNPNFLEAYSLRASTFGLLGQADRAISDFNKTLEKEPNYASAYNARGLAYKLNGDIDKALADFNYAIKLGFKEAYIGRSGLLIMKGDYNAALKDAQMTIDIFPNYHEGWSARAFCLATKGKYKQALEDIDKALKIDFKNPEVWLTIGSVHYIAGHNDKAILALQKFLEYATAPFYNNHKKIVRQKIRNLEAN